MFELSKEILGTHEAVVTVEVEDSVLEQQLQQAARKLSKSRNFPGFRKGKVPYHIVVRHIGLEALRIEAIEQLVEHNYQDWLKQLEIAPYDMAKLEDLSFEPCVITLRIPLAPVIDLGDYHSLRKPAETASITDEEIDDTLETLRLQLAKREKVERPIAMGDLVVLAEVNGVVDGETLLHDHNQYVLMRPDAVFIAAGGLEQLIGLSAGESKEFGLPVSLEPDADSDEPVPSEMQVAVTVGQVFSLELPQLDDAFASAAGPFESMADLRAALVKQALEHKQAHLDQDYMDAVLDMLVEQATLRYPPQMVEEALDEQIADLDAEFKKNRQPSLEDALRLQGQTLDALRDSLRPSVVKRLHYGLVLGRLLHEEKIDLSKDDLAVYEKRAAALKTAEERSKFVDHMLTDKTLERLAQIARGEAATAD